MTRPRSAGSRRPCPRWIAPKSESSASRIFRHSGITVAFKTTFEVFTGVSPDNSLERLVLTESGYVHRSEDVCYRVQLSLLFWTNRQKIRTPEQFSSTAKRNLLLCTECYTSTEGSNYGEA